MTFPHPDELEALPRCFVLHWTAGGHRASAYERQRYHLLCEHHGDRAKLVAGVPIERNMRPRLSGPAYHQDPSTGYAAHAGGFNTRAIGVAACGMRGAVDYRPSGQVYPGESPITLHELRLMIGTVVSGLLFYGMEVTPDTVLTHYEVWKRGIGRSKWNISWLPGFGLEAHEVGPFLREQIRLWMRGDNIDDRLYVPPIGQTPEEALEGDEAA